MLSVERGGRNAAIPLERSQLASVINENGGIDISVYGLVHRYSQAFSFTASDLVPAAAEVEWRRFHFGTY